MEASKVASNSPLLLGIFAFIELCLIIAVIVIFSQFVGSSDKANEVSKLTVTSTTLLGFIVLFHTCLWYVYFTYNPISMNLYFLVTTSMCMIISLTALGISITTRS